MEELNESARQCLVSQGIIIGTLSVLNSLGLLLIGLVVMSRAHDILHFTSLTHLAILEIICGVSSLLLVGLVWWLVTAYRSKQVEIRSSYLDENLSRALIALLLPLVLTFTAFVVSAIFLMLKTETTSTYDLKSAMSLYSTDFTRKVILDKLQISLECCGSQSLLDWFLIDWQNADAEPGGHLENKTISDWDSVPYSCCTPESPPPCIHHQLRVFGVGSLYTVGCADKLDEAVFIYLVVTLVLFFASTFLMLLMMYTARKLQTSARSACQSGDPTANGVWWILSPPAPKPVNFETLALLSQKSDEVEAEPSPGPPQDDSFEDIEKAEELQEEEEEEEIEEQEEEQMPEEEPSLLGSGSDQVSRNSPSVADFWVKPKRIVMNPVLVVQKSKIIDSTMNEDWETYKSVSKNIPEGDSSEDWTRRAYDASGSTSTTSFLTTSVPINSTPESRRSVSDTAVANLEVSHHFEHKVRPLYRS